MRGRHTHILVVALALVATPVASAGTPSWYSQLNLAVLDADGADAAMDTCEAPRSARQKAGRLCSIARASEESIALDRVAVFAEIGAIVGPCRRRLLKLDDAATAASARALRFATSHMTMAKEGRERGALARAARRVTADFAELRLCLVRSL